MGSTRGQFSSRFGFIMAAAGSAVGLGNVWGFPTNTASNGGGAFLLMYLVLAFCLAYPALMAELVIGRHTKSNMVSALQKVATSRLISRFGQLTGFCGLIVASLILSFYSIVAGWMISHTIEPVATAMGFAELAGWLTDFGTTRNLLFAGLFSLLTIWVISAGVENGIEKWSSRLMPSLLIILMLLIVYVLFQDGAIDGLKHYLVPDFARITDPQLMISALGQAFFSLSLGVGTMLIYGSYISKQENLPKLGAIVTGVDISIAFFAGLLILPAMFVAQHNGVQIYSEAGALISEDTLIFQTLPALFKTMGSAGLFVAFAFFTLMSIAALTSSISMLEVPVSYAVEAHSMKRRTATWIIGLIILAISTLIILNFESLFLFVVHLTTRYSQPLLGIAICLFAGWVMHRHKILEEIRQGLPNAEQTLFWKVWPAYVRYFCPTLIAITFIQSLRA
ncbi:sodium-dependent transporter [bacterium SCSIO 12696]|nr:sodium-dependent transporter [bacterium SCSIO 12696]